jgi:general secretion pathway protein I
MKRQPCRAKRPVLRAGFTLIEVLVALGIVAIALTAGLKATASLARNAERQSNVLLAQLCAENELIKLRLAQQMPGVGDSTSDCAQAGEVMQVQTSVRSTPNPNFLRVDAKVFKDTEAQLQLTTVMGRN